MAKQKVHHNPGYVCLKKAKLSASQVRAKEAKAKEIASGKKKYQDIATAKLMAKKGAKKERQNAKVGSNGFRYYDD